MVRNSLDKKDAEYFCWKLEEAELRSLRSVIACDPFTWRYPDGQGYLLWTRQSNGVLKSILGSTES